MLIGYLRLVTTRPQPASETLHEQLIDSGCTQEMIFTDRIVGKNWQRPCLERALELMACDDSLVVPELHHLGHNLSEIASTATMLSDRDIHLRVLHPDIDTTRSSDRSVMDVLESLAQWDQGVFSRATQAGQVRARAQGSSPGPKPKMTLEQKFKGQVPCSGVAVGAFGSV